MHQSKPPFVSNTTRILRSTVLPQICRVIVLINEFTNLIFFSKKHYPLNHQAKTSSLRIQIWVYLPEKLELLWAEFRSSGRNSDTICCIDKIQTVKVENNKDKMQQNHSFGTIFQFFRYYLISSEEQMAAEFRQNYCKIRLRLMWLTFFKKQMA